MSTPTDMLSLHNQQLKMGKIQFLQSLQPEADQTFGHKNKPRDQEPSMKQLLTWGYEAPVKGDFTKNTPNIKCKIKKMGKEYVSEVQDNYRKPEYSPEKGIYLFNYLDEEGQDKWKKKIIDMALAEESEEKKTSTYK